MKILQISKFFPPAKGGIESVTFELAEGFSRQGVCGDVLCFNSSGAGRSERSGSGYEVVRVGSWGMLMSTPLAPALILQTLRRRSAYDVIHVHMPNPMAALAIWIARPKAQIVVHWHSDVVRQQRGLKFYKPLQDWLLKRADAIVATSEIYAQASACLSAFHGKTEIIPLGIGDPVLTLDIDRSRRLRERYAGKKVIFALGRMTYYKGFDVLVKAARLLPADSLVVIAGGGALLSSLRAQARRLGVADRVQFLGNIDEADKLAYLQMADVFCMPSVARSEAYGLAMVEAMAMGKPIVSTDISGSGASWINQSGVTGLTVPVGDPEQLARAIAKLLADPASAARMGRAARQRYVDELQADKMMDSIFLLYRRLLSGFVSTGFVPTIRSAGLERTPGRRDASADATTPTEKNP
ncbi:MAG: glycosyltransferase [Pseudomonadota bacterium]